MDGHSAKNAVKRCVNERICDEDFIHAQMKANFAFRKSCETSHPVKFRVKFCGTHGNVHVALRQHVLMQCTHDDVQCIISAAVHFAHANHCAQCKSAVIIRLTLASLSSHGCVVNILFTFTSLVSSSRPCLKAQLSPHRQ